MVCVDTDGSIYVEDHFIGTFEGFEFREDAGAFPDDGKIPRAVANKILRQEIQRRVAELTGAEDGELSLILGDPMTRSTINWRGIAIARVIRGRTILTPKAVVIPTPQLHGDCLAQTQIRVDRWLENHIGDILSPLFALQEAVNGAVGPDGKNIIDGIARGIAFQMVEKLGTIPRQVIARDFRSVTSEGRFQLKQLGIWLGAASLYIPSLLKPAPAQLRLFLWALFADRERLPERPVAGLCTIATDPKAPRLFYEVSGYRVVGKNAVRLDMLERLANAAREISLKGPFPATPDLMSLVGCSGEDFVEIMAYLGYVYREYSPAQVAKMTGVPLPDPHDSTEKATAEVKVIVTDKEQLSAPATENPVTENPVTENPVTENPVISGIQPPQAGGGEEKIVTDTEQLEAPEKIFLFRYQPYQKPDRMTGREAERKRKPGRLEKSSGDKNNPKDNNIPKDKKIAKDKNSARKNVGTRRGRKGAVIDPHNPFAALAGMKTRLKTKK